MKKIGIIGAMELEVETLKWAETGIKCGKNKKKIWRKRGK